MSTRRRASATVASATVASSLLKRTDWKSVDFDICLLSLGGREGTGVWWGVGVVGIGSHSSGVAEQEPKNSSKADEMMSPANYLDPETEIFDFSG